MSKMHVKTGDTVVVISGKYANGKDISDLGAIECGDSFELRVRVPRRLGATGVVLRIAADGGADAA